MAFPVHMQLCAGTATDCSIINEQYAWDALGNLHTQLKQNRYLETFTYDTLNRLTSATVQRRNGNTVNQQTLSQSYDRLGNLCRKTEGGSHHDYHYTGRAGCGLGNGNSGHGSGAFNDTRPHAVANVGGFAYHYDAKGNQTTRTGGNAPNRTIRYSADNHAYSIEMSNGTRARFWYGSDGQRYKHQDQDGKVTLYLGNVEIIKQGNAQTIKRMVAGVQQQTIIGNTITTRYFFYDRLGSIAKITNAEGTPEASQDYKAYGGRRDYNNPNAAGTPTSLTDRGYTGHEHLDGLDVIHMNGRIYDPVLQRFLQPDPVVQAPGNLQSWNAYTYVFNNPLVYTDPTGMMSFKSFVRLVISVVITYYTGGWGATLWSGGNYVAALAVVAGGGYASGYVQTGSGKGGLGGAYSSLMFFGVGRLVAHFQWSKTEQVAAHALAGGVLADVQGGNFGHGFYTAGLNKAVMANVPTTGSDLGDTALMALAGGTISAATGGKFANGAVTAAIQFSLNQLTQTRDRTRFTRQEPPELKKLLEKYPLLKQKMQEATDKSYSDKKYRREYGFIAFENLEGDRIAIYSYRAIWRRGLNNWGYKSIPMNSVIDQVMADGREGWYGVIQFNSIPTPSIRATYTVVLIKDTMAPLILI